MARLVCTRKNRLDKFKTLIEDAYTKNVKDNLLIRVSNHMNGMV